MYLEPETVNYLNKNFRKEKKYISKSVIHPAVIFNEVSDIKSADMLITENCSLWCHKYVVSNTGNAHTKDYKYTELQRDVLLYTKQDSKNDNLFWINKEKDKNSLVRFSPKENFKKTKRISHCFGQFCDKNLLIVGAGESNKTISPDKLLCDVMVINYNFDFPANWLIYHDRRVAEDLSGVEFKDGRKIIGEQANAFGIADYYYSSCDFKHTGAYAIWIARQLGYDNIYLIGYDYSHDKYGQYHTYQTNGRCFYTDEKITGFLKDFERLDYKNVFNLNPKSRLTKYKQKPKEVVYGKSEKD